MDHCDRIRCEKTSANVGGRHVCLCDCDECAEAQREELEQLERDRARTRGVSEEARRYRETYADDRPPPARPRSSGPWMYVLGIGMFAAAGVWLFGQSGGKLRDERVSTAVSTDETEQAAAHATQAPTRQPSLDERLAGMGLAAAIGRLRPSMQDTEGGELSEADKAFARWAARGMKWAELSAISETEPGLVMKDPDKERGRRVCVSGSIIQIRAEHGDYGTAFHGTFMLYGGEVVRYVAVGDTGELVEKSGARFCGIVTGTSSYPNTGGGTTHAIMAVGMFDLPANRQAKK